MKKCELLIIGAGPAGMEAAIYGARYGMETVVLEKKYAGGQIASTHMLENYLGFPDGVSGADFAAAIKTQAEKLGAAVESADVTAVRREGGLFEMCIRDRGGPCWKEGRRLCPPDDKFRQWYRLSSWSFP